LCSDTHWQAPDPPEIPLGAPPSAAAGCSTKDGVIDRAMRCTAAKARLRSPF
jgi:hypothetical protein